MSSVAVVMAGWRGCGRHLQDARAELDLFGERADPGERGEGVGAVRLGGPDGIEAEPLGLLRKLDAIGAPAPQ